MEYVEIDYSDLEYQEFLFFNNLEEREQINTEVPIDPNEFCFDTPTITEDEVSGFELVHCEEKEIKFIETLHKLASIELKNFINNNDHD